MNGPDESLRIRPGPVFNYQLAIIVVTIELETAAG